MLHPLYPIPHKMVHRYFFNRDQAVVCEHEFAFRDAGLCFFSRQAGHFSDHRVEIGGGIDVESVDQFGHPCQRLVDTAAVGVGIMDREPRFLLREVD